jgi:hypothetical protein
MTAEKPKRRRADYRKTAVAVRRILVVVGRPLWPSEIYPKLSPELRAQIEPNKLTRVLQRSQRAGLLHTKDGWFVKPAWLKRTDKDWQRKRSRSSLARTRRLAERACETALDLLRSSGNAIAVKNLFASIKTPGVDQRKFGRALWNRAKSEPHLHRVTGGCYIWIPIASNQHPPSAVSVGSSSPSLAYERESFSKAP